MCCPLTCEIKWGVFFMHRFALVSAQGICFVSGVWLSGFIDLRYKCKVLYWKVSK